MLANLNSVSMSEMTCMAKSVLPNMAVSWANARSAVPAVYGDYKFAYSGAWENSAVSVYGSTAVMKDARKIHEGVGIVPISRCSDPEVEAEMRSGVYRLAQRTGGAGIHPHREMTAAVRMTITGRCHTAPPAVCGRGMPRPCRRFVRDAADAERHSEASCRERAAAQKSSRMAEDCGIFTIFAG